MKSAYLIIAVLGCVVLHAAEPAMKTTPLTPQQTAQMQEFSKRAALIAQERQDKQRAWDAEMKVIQLEFREWVQQSCKSIGAEGCIANVQDADPSKWTWGIPEKPKPEPTTAKPSAKEN